MANPETLLGEIEAKTRELIGTVQYANYFSLTYDQFSFIDEFILLLLCLILAKRTTPLLEYIKNKKIEKQVRNHLQSVFDV